MIHANSMAGMAAMEPITGECRIEVMKVIREKGPITRQDIAQELGWEINRITGRVRELLDKNNICEDGQDRSHSVARSLLRVMA
jgi:predicted transcriptional regulator